MRVISKADGDALAAKIASQVCRCSAAKRIIVADMPASDINDEAKQSAISYWMMGWSWDEIETVLEDSEYKSNVITHAIKETKEYARKLLNEGPFAMMTAGQGVKLASGDIGVIEDIHADHLVINVGGSVGIARVGAAHVDIDATKQLSQAFELRSNAEKMLSTLDDDSKIGCARNAAVVSGDPLVTAITASLASLQSIKQSSDELVRVAQQSYDVWVGDKGEHKVKSDTEQEFLQYLAATVTQEKELDNEVNDLVYHKLVSGLEHLHDAAVSVQHTSDEVSSAKAALQNYLTEEFPSVIRSIEAHIYEMNRKNSKIGEYTQQFDKFDAQSAEQGDWSNEAVIWIKSVWDTTKKCVEHWSSQLVPTIEKGSALVSTCLNAVEKAHEVGTVQAAMKQRGL